jgi:hypothetical protein
MPMSHIRLFRPVILVLLSLPQSQSSQYNQSSLLLNNNIEETIIRVSLVKKPQIEVNLTFLSFFKLIVRTSALGKKSRQRKKEWLILKRIIHSVLMLVLHALLRAFKGSN